MTALRISARSMITHTFQLLPSVGAKKERAIWETGVRSWDDFLSADAVGTMKREAKERGDVLLTQASELLDDGDSRSLADMLPKGEVWRMYRRFARDAVYLDIETDGLSTG